MTSRRDVVPGEDPEELERRIDDWNITLVPTNPVERQLVETAVKASWKVERAERYLAARARAQVENAPDQERSEVECLRERLFHNPQRPTELYGIGRYEHEQPRISWSATGELDDPAELVRKITASATGCEILLNEWRTLRSRLEPGQFWLSPDKFKALRMLGCQPLDCLNVRTIAELLVASWAIDPQRGNAYSELKCELDDIEHKAFVDRVRRRWPDMLDAGKPEEARRILVAIVDRAIDDLEAKPAMHKQNAERDAIRRMDCLAFNHSPDCVRVMGYELSCSRTMLRSLTELSKLRRSAERNVHKPQPLAAFAQNEDQRDYAVDNAGCELQGDDDRRILDSEPAGTDECVSAEDMFLPEEHIPTSISFPAVERGGFGGVDPARLASRAAARRGEPSAISHHHGNLDADSSSPDAVARFPILDNEPATATGRPALEQPALSADVYESVIPGQQRHEPNFDNEPAAASGHHSPEKPASPADPHESVSPDAQQCPPILDNEPDFGIDENGDWTRTAAAASAGLIAQGTLKDLIVNELRRREARASTTDEAHSEVRRHRRRHRHRHRSHGSRNKHRLRRLGTLNERPDVPLLAALPGMDFSSLLAKVERDLEEELTRAPGMLTTRR
jgi:hypothetical protein